IISILPGIILFAGIANTLHAQEYIVNAEDVRVKVLNDPTTVLAGVYPDEHTIYALANGLSGIHEYTDRVNIKLNEKRFDVIFLSDNPPEVALQKHAEWPSTVEGFENNPGEKIPDYINYKGKLFKVVELINTQFTNNNIALPNSIRYIQGAFTKAEGEINLAEGLITLGENAIIFCPDLTLLSFPKSLRIINSNAANGYEEFEYGKPSQLRTIKFSPNIMRIYSNNFNYFTHLEEVNLPFKLNSLGADCFNNLTDLKKVYINPYISYMENCFNDCPNIEEIIIDKYIDDLVLVNCFNAVDKSKCIVRVKQTPFHFRPDNKFWEGFNIAGIDQTGVENVFPDAQISGNDITIYDISGKALRSTDNLKHGDVYIEQHNNTSQKKIAR
ncbi:MAG: leucine-rich repeat domain-containing protein, partial [Muribaculaceae bacterium]|nr:leucine-rich repeat domain-containing protein [Muribaculaceae bacterium]